MLAADQIPGQRRRADIGEDGPPGSDVVTGFECHSCCPAAVDLNGRDLSTSPDLGAMTFGSTDQGLYERVGASDRDGETNRVPEHHEQPPVQGAAHSVRRQVSVQGVAGEQNRAARSPESLLAEAAHRLRRHPGEAQQLAHPELPREPGRATDRRERTQQRVDQPVTNPLPLSREAQPRVPVPMKCGERRRGLRRILPQRGRPAVRQQVRQHSRCPGPPQPMCSEIEPADHRRGRGKRVESAEQISAERRPKHLGRATAPPATDCASHTSTSHPASARMFAATRPL